MTDRMRRAENTGEIRFRCHRDWRGREYVVLQMKWRGLLTTWAPGGSDTEWVTEWRDARVEDFPVSGNVANFQRTGGQP
jgi:hypothetical protein